VSAAVLHATTIVAMFFNQLQGYIDHKYHLKHSNPAREYTTHATELVTNLATIFLLNAPPNEI